MAGTQDSREQDLINAVFMIRTKSSLGSSRGTGFLVQESHVLTAWHVIRNALSIEVKVGDRWIPAVVKNAFENQEAALLRLAEPVTVAPPLALKAQDRFLGRGFKVRGFARDLDVSTYETGMIDSPAPQKGLFIVRFDPEPKVHLRGMSGGPVLDRDTGEVLGILNNHDPKLSNVGKIVGINSVIDFLDFSDQDPARLECVVILSDSEPRNGEQPVDDVLADLLGEQQEAPDSLRRVMNLVLPTLRIPGHEIAVTPHCIYASEAVNSRESYSETIRALCHAEIAVFDLTGFEPAVMLLLGIRSVVRRGITIASVGADYTVGKVPELPFNINDVNTVAHSDEQEEVGAERRRTPADLIRRKIEEGWALRNQPDYLDLPAFNLVRKVSADKRDLIPYTDQILLLCSYKPYYQERGYKIVRDALTAAVIDEQPTADPEVVRVLDIVTSRLVSQTIFEAIRTMSFCVVDWSDWRPNVFFELGVRLAITGPGMVTLSVIEDIPKRLIERMVEQPNEAGTLLDRVRQQVPEMFVPENFSQLVVQCARLLALFQPLDYHADRKSKASFERMLHYRAAVMDEYAGAASATTLPGLPPTHTYDLIYHAIDADTEFPPVPVHRHLLDEARLFTDSKNRGKSWSLYPRDDVQQAADRWVNERLLAAWFFLRGRYTEDTVRRDQSLVADVLAVGNELLVRLDRADKTFEGAPESLVADIRAVVDALQATDAASALPQSPLDAVRGLKMRAKAHKTGGEIDNAVAALESAIEAGETALAALPEGSNDPDDIRLREALERELADAYGQRGGLLRRQDRLDEALVSYENGLRYEDKFKDDSYNLSNWIVIQLLLDPSRLGDLTPRITQAVRDVGEQVRGARSDQWWAWADLGLFHLLRGADDSLEAAFSAYSNFRRVGARAADYASVIGVLVGLRDKLNGDPAAQAVAELFDGAIAYMEDQKPAE